MAKVEETCYWITGICGVRSKTARTGLIVTLPVRFPVTTCSWREWFAGLQIASEEVRRKLRVKNVGLV
jgi:hypothetical protein